MMSSPTSRLLGSLLPASWPDRAAILESATRLDDKHGGDGSGVLLRAWATWRATGEVPNHPLVRDALQALGQLLGGIASEMRYRPRFISTNHEPQRVTSPLRASPGARSYAPGSFPNPPANVAGINTTQPAVAGANH